MGIIAMVKRNVETDAAWHLDKKVPIALIFAILLQTGGIVWWGASASERLNTLERRVEMTAPQGDRLTRVEVKVDNALDGIAEIKSILRREQPGKSQRN
jgi:hypothetical protein